MMRQLIVLLIFTLSLQAATLEQSIDEVVNRWEAPAVAVAIVKDGEVVLNKGYGKGRPDSFFHAGSVTKAMTCAALALLVEDGKIKWEDSVSRHLPEFQPKDAYFARNLTIADLVSHRAGLESGQGNLLMTRYSAKESLPFIARLEPKHPFRTRYAYQNVYYTVAGQLIEKVSGIPYEAFIETRVLEPLGMRKSGTRKRPSVAPYVKLGEKLSQVERFSMPGGVAAGGIVSNVEEMTFWLKEMLSPKLLGVKSVERLLAPHVVVPRQDLAYATHPGVGLINYGLGWLVYDWEGEQVAEHAGRYPGYSCRVFLLPKKKIGIVVMCNQKDTLLPLAVCYTVMEQLVHTKNRNWSGIFEGIERQIAQKQKEEQQAFHAARVGGTSPTHSLDAFSGSYHHAAYGEIKVDYAKDKLTLGFGPHLEGALKHWHHDTFMVDWESKGAKGAIGTLPINFSLDHEGNVAILRFGDEISFKRR